MRRTVFILKIKMSCFSVLVWKWWNLDTQRKSLSSVVGESYLLLLTFFLSSQVSAALVRNFPTISTSTIQTLGNQSVGLTQGQISTLTPTVINSAMATLSTVTGWNQGQANALIQSITTAGFTVSVHCTQITWIRWSWPGEHLLDFYNIIIQNFLWCSAPHCQRLSKVLVHTSKELWQQVDLLSVRTLYKLKMGILIAWQINSASSLVTLGTLVGGVPSSTINSIPSTQLLTASQNPTFIINILSAPVIVQSSVVQKVKSSEIFS